MLTKGSDHSPGTIQTTIDEHFRGAQRKWVHLLHKQTANSKRLSMKEVALQLSAKKRSRKGKPQAERRASVAAHISYDLRRKHHRLSRNFWIDLLRNHVDTHHASAGENSLERLSSLEGVHSATMNMDVSEHQSILEDLAEQFDQTHAGISSLFHLLDADEDGSIGYDEFQLGLSSQNLLHLDGDKESLKKLMAEVDTSGDGKIDMEEFAMCLERLRLARLHLLDKSMILLGSTANIHCIDYDSFSTVTQLPVMEKELFFFGSDVLPLEEHENNKKESGGHTQTESDDPTQAKKHGPEAAADPEASGGLNYVGDPSLDTRWVHMIGHDNLLILQLGVKFGLHPMSILDALQLHTKSASCSKYGDDFFLCFPQIRLDDKNTSRLHILQSVDASDHELVSSDVPPFPGLIRLEEAATGIFYLHGQALLLSLELDWKAFSEDPISDGPDSSSNKATDSRGRRSPRSKSPVMGKRPSNVMHQPIVSSRYIMNAGIGKTRRRSASGHFTGTGTYADVVKIYGHESLLAQVLKQLTRKYTVIRRSGISRLLHAIIEKIVDNMRSIPAAFRIQLDWYHTELLRTEAKFGKEHVQSLLVIKRELGRLEHKLKPLEKVMTTLIKSGTFEDISYFEDVYNDIRQIGYELSRHKGTVEELTTSFEHYHDRKLNNSLAILTTITGAVVPWQMFTAFWGMNFMTETGGFQDWFLETPGGIYWATVVLFILTVLMYGWVRYVVIGA